MKTPVVLQGESNECGLACIAMLLGSHGRYVDLASLRDSDSNGRQLSLDYLAQLASQQGFTVRALRCELPDLQDVHVPFIAHVDFEHYVVVTRVSRARVTVHDPSLGQVVMTHKSFSERFTGIVLECRAGPDFRREGKPPVSYTRRILGRLNLRELLPGLAGLLVLTLVVQLLVLLAPYYLQLVVDQVLMLSNIDLLGVLTTGFLLVYLLAALTRFLRGLVIIRLGGHLSYSLAAGLMDKALHLPLAYFRRRQIGDFTSRFSSLKPLQAFVSQGVVSLLLDGLMMLVTLVVMALLSPPVAACVLAITTVFILVQILLMKPYRLHSHEQVINDARLQSCFVETVQAINVIRRNQLTDRRLRLWLNRLVETINPQIRASQWEQGMETCRFLAAGCLTLSVVHLSVEDITAGTMSIGMLYTLVAYAGHFATAASGCSMQWQSLTLLALHSQRLADIVEQPEEQRIPLHLPEPVSSIALTGVSLARSNQQLFDGLTLHARANDKIAITGPSGAGKSSLFSLLLGEVQPQQGEVLVNQAPLHTGTDPSAYMSVLHQHDQLLEGSVMDNITLGDPAPDHEAMLRAARLALIHEDILRLPLAYREKLTARSNLSSGQQQRLLIARALYRDKPVLLLDEATCHLDEATEQLVMENILALPGICLFVTHRRAVAAMADRIIQLPGGNVSTAPQRHAS